MYARSIRSQRFRCALRNAKSAGRTVGTTKDVCRYYVQHSRCISVSVEKWHESSRANSAASLNETRIRAAAYQFPRDPRGGHPHRPRGSSSRQTNVAARAAQLKLFSSDAATVAVVLQGDKDVRAIPRSLKKRSFPPSFRLAVIVAGLRLCLRAGPYESERVEKERRRPRGLFRRLGTAFPINNSRKRLPHIFGRTNNIFLSATARSVGGPAVVS